MTSVCKYKENRPFVLSTTLENKTVDLNGSFTLPLHDSLYNLKTAGMTKKTGVNVQTILTPGLTYVPTIAILFVI